MLVNGISAFNAVVPKEVLSGTKEQNFKTKPMGYDSVSFGMAKVPELARNQSDYLFQKLVTWDNKGFIDAIRDYSGEDKKRLYNALTEEFRLPSSYSNSGGSANAMKILDSKERYEIDFLKAITNAFGSNKPKDNEMLAELMLQFTPNGIKDYTLYAATIKRLALGAEGVSDSLSAKLIVQGLENNSITEYGIKDYGEKAAGDKLFFDIARFGSSKFFVRTIKSHAEDKDALSSLLAKKFDNYGDGEMSVFELALTKEDTEPLQTIINSFDKKDPKHSKMLAELLASAKTPCQMDYRVGRLYHETLEYLALDCPDVPNGLSMRLIDKILKSLGPEVRNSKYAGNLEIAKKWLSGNKENQ